MSKKEASPRLDALRAMREAKFQKVQTPKAPKPKKNAKKMAGGPKVPGRSQKDECP